MPVPTSFTWKRSIDRVARPSRYTPSGPYLDLCLGHWKRWSLSSHLSAVFWCGHDSPNA